jgi:hypothetical protein
VDRPAPRGDRARARGDHGPAAAGGREEKGPRGGVIPNDTTRPRENRHSNRRTRSKDRKRMRESGWVGWGGRTDVIDSREVIPKKIPLFGEIDLSQPYCIIHKTLSVNALPRSANR